MSLEADIQKDVLQALHTLGHAAWRINTMGVPIHRKGEEGHFRPAPTKGIADVLGIRKRDGRFIAVEVKQPGKKPSDDQEIFLDQVRRKGGIAIVATSIDDILKHPELKP